MRKNKIKIGYVPFNPREYNGLDSASPCDRRRLAALVPYWEKEGFEVKAANFTEDFDIIYFVSVQTNFKLIKQYLKLKYRRKIKFAGGITEDPFSVYLATCRSNECQQIKNHSLLFYKGLKGKCRKIKEKLAAAGLMYHPVVTTINNLKKFDHIITTSENQACLVRQRNINTSAIVDTMPDSEYKNVCSYNDDENGTVRIVWEGNSFGLQLIDLLKPVLEKLYNEDGLNFKFYFISKRFRGDELYGSLDNVEIMEKNFNFPGRFIEWDIETAGKHLSSMDIGIAPFPDNNPYYINKAYSKCLSYMKCGLPVVASDIPSHRELIRHGYDGFIAGGLDDWYKYLKELIESPALRQKTGRQGYLRQEQKCGAELIAGKYIKIFKQMAGE